MKKICVIDGQGGGIGSTIIRRLRDVFGQDVEIIALGTNAIATAQMLKAGANRGASGENSIVRMMAVADLILGPLAVVLANAMMGEVTPAMAQAVASSRAPKFLLPLVQEEVTIVGVCDDPLPHLVDTMLEQHLRSVLEGGG